MPLTNAEIALLLFVLVDNKRESTAAAWLEQTIRGYNGQAKTLAAKLIRAARASNGY